MNYKQNFQVGLKHSRSSRRRHHKSGPLKRLTRKIRKFIKNLFISDAAPKEFRPYLGPDASEEEVEEHKFENTRASIKTYGKKKKARRKFSLFKKFREKFDWEKYKSDRKKKKHRRRAKKKQLKKEKERKRIEYIRRFIPQYKKDQGITIEAAANEVADDKEKERHKSYYVYTINSTITYLIAYLAVYLIYQITVLITASRWKLDSVLYYFDLAFNDYSPLWNRLNIIIVTLSGPLISLLIALLFMRVLSHRIHTNKTLKLLTLWIGLHGYNLFLGAFASGVSFDEGFGYVAAWLYMSVFMKILFSMVFLFILGLIGYYAASNFLETSYSVTRIRQNNKIKFLFFQVVLPWLIGASFIYLVKLPNNMNYDSGNLVTMAFAVLPVLFNRMSKPSKGFKTLKKPNQIQWLYLVILILLLIGFRIGLDNGLHIELFYKFTFNLDITPI
ncbi:MAG: hypothetical protein K9G76_01335 [Bacteroidales bacterium]|nr:hypothetical protein [Bacteroidales bacterium]MCF8403195.1 hypothetical protein [Bacteroidales bacterium]